LLETITKGRTANSRRKPLPCSEEPGRIAYVSFARQHHDS
jgi:hypothetical protein